MVCFGFLLGTGYFFLQNSKISWMVELEWPCEMRMCAVEDLKGACDLQIIIGDFNVCRLVWHGVPCLRQGRQIQFRVLFGGHTSALQFRLCIQLPTYEGKHAIRNKRLHEEETVTACIAHDIPEMILLSLYVRLPIHFLHELSLCKYRTRRAFYHKIRPDAMQRMEMSRRTHVIKNTMVNVVPKKPINEIRKFSNWFWKYYVAAIYSKMVATSINGRSIKHFFHDHAFLPLSKLFFFREWGAHFGNKKNYIFLKGALNAWKAQIKKEIVYEVVKLVAWMHTLVFPDNYSKAKKARDCNQKKKISAGVKQNNYDRNS